MNGRTNFQLGLFAGATVLLLAAVFWISATRRFLRSASTAKGTVEDNLRVVDNDGAVFYRPRFAFMTADGQQVIVQSKVGTNPPSFRKGEPIMVLYDPSVPEHARINTFMQLWLGPTVCAATGIGFLVVGCFMH